MAWFVQHLRAVAVPDDLALRRLSDVPEELRTEVHDRLFDDRTLFYDCVPLQSGRLLLTGPHLRNLRPLVVRGLRAGGTRPRVRIRDIGRVTQTMVQGEGPVVLETAAGPVDVPVRESVAERFSGRNVAVCVNKDNALGHVRDWLRFHVSAHGLDGVLVFDNGSTTYGVEELARTMADVPGVAVAGVISAPFNYGGPFDLPGRRVRLQFLQPALLNLARAEALSRARAVLGVDIDELVVPLDGVSVFDAAAARRIGFVRLGGQWVFPGPGAEAPARHGAHRFRQDPPLACGAKWAVRPDALIPRLKGWNVHNVGGAIGYRTKVDPRFEILHCVATTTGWKPDSKRWRDWQAAVPDARLGGILDRYLPEVGA